MLSFQTLPAEILFNIAQNVGSAHLRARVDRVLLCRSWYNVTHSVVWEEIELSVNAFERYKQAPTDIQSLIQSRLRSLSVSGVCDKITTIPFQSSEAEPGHQAARRLAKLRGLLLTRNTTLCDSIGAFSSTLPQMHKLQTFKLKLSSQSTVYTEPDNKNTWTDTIRRLITSFPKILTSLTIDKLGPTSKYSIGMSDPHAVCKVVLAKDVLPSLKQLRLRTHCICPLLFSTNTIDVHQNLESLVIALEAYSPKLGRVYHAHCCTQPQQSSRRLFDDMVDAARKAVNAGCFPSLKTLRILRYDLDALVFFSWDVLEGREAELPFGVEWDDVEWDDVEWEKELGMDGLAEETSSVVRRQFGEEDMDEVAVGVPAALAIGIPIPSTLMINVAANG